MNQVNYLVDDRVVTANEYRVVTAVEFKQHSRIDYDSEDALIESYLQAAEHHIQTITGRGLMTQTREAVFRGWPWSIYLPTPQVASIESFHYLDADETSTLMAAADYQTDRLGLPWSQARIRPIGSWPSGASDAHDVIRIRYICGYGPDPEDVPATIKMAIRLMVAHWYEHREAAIVNAPVDIPMGVRSLIEPERFRRDMWSDEQ